MTEKKQKIIDIAIKLFATEGYANTATSKIAKAAGVSEGLIFKHFKSKAGLLDAIVDIGLEDAISFMIEINKIQEPKAVLILALNLPKYLLGRQNYYWRLHHSLKYQNPEIAAKYKGSNLFKQLTKTIESAFGKLGYQEPNHEASLFLLIIAGLFSNLVNDELEIHQQLKSFIMKKYEL